MNKQGQAKHASENDLPEHEVSNCASSNATVSHKESSHYQGATALGQDGYVWEQQDQAQSGESLGQGIKSGTILGSDAPFFEKGANYSLESPEYTALGSLSDSSDSTASNHSADSSEVREALQREESAAREPFSLQS